MPCESLIRECWEWHVKPHLDSPRPNDKNTGARALCPAHDDGDPSLSIGIGDNGRITWRCFAGCTRTRVRAALIVAGIPAGCLPLVTREKEEVLDFLARILTADTADHAGIRLRAVAALEGYADLPRGAELDRIAGLARTNRATAYRARKSALPSTHNPGSYSPAKMPVKPRRSGPTGKVA